MPASTRVHEQLTRGQPAGAGTDGWKRLTRGGPAGNGVLTSITAVALLALLAAEGVTILRLRPLLYEHMFIGMVLIPVVCLKLASTGYRFLRYYSGSGPYVRRGPPELALRLLAPAVVLSSIAVLGTGVWLLVAGPVSRDTALPLHKLSFFAWLALMGLHVLGHLTELSPALRSEYRTGQAGGPAPSVSGRGARQVVLLAAVAAGVLLALLVISLYAPWLHSGPRGAGR